MFTSALAQGAVIGRGSCEDLSEKAVVSVHVLKICAPSNSGSDHAVNLQGHGQDQGHQAYS